MNDSSTVLREKPARCPTAFTLIELLVVIAIIAALPLPAVAKRSVHGT